MNESYLFAGSGNATHNLAPFVMNILKEYSVILTTSFYGMNRKI